MDKKKDEKGKEISLIDLIKIVFSDENLSRLTKMASKEFLEAKKKAEKKRDKK